MITHRIERELESLLVPGAEGGFLLAVSGGPDSTALSLLFDEFRGRRPSFPPIVIAHVHHGLRGEEADRDLEFVSKLAQNLGLDFVSERVDVRSLARERGESIELTARNERYRQLEAWSLSRGLDYVVTAHHASDQAETILLRLARGTGLRGLAGIPRRRPLVRGHGSPWLLRPLLRFRRAELIDYLAARGQDYREDLSNRDVSIPRNAVRHGILPELRQRVHPGAEEALVRLAEQSRRLFDDLERLAGELWPRVRDVDDDSPTRVSFSYSALRELPGTLRGLVLRRALDELAERRGLEARTLSDAQEEEIQNRLFSGADCPNDTVPIQGLGRVACGDGRVRVHGEDETGIEARPTPGPRSMPLPGEVEWGGWSIRGEVLGARPEIPVDDPFCEVFDLDLLSGPLGVRARRPGDRFHPLGAPGPKKLKEFLRECGLPVDRRDAHPLVVTSDRPLWVVGKRLAHPYRVTDSTRSWGRLRASPIKTSRREPE